MTRDGLLAGNDFLNRAKALLPGARRSADKLSHHNALLRLKAAGFAPAVVFDIGAYRGGWTHLASEIFPDATYVLFEANADNVAHLTPLPHRHFIVALAAIDGEKTFYLPRDADVTGASLYVEASSHYAGDKLVVRPVSTARLDTWVALHDLPAPDLVKLDVQGAELDVLAGGPRSMAHCQALIAELSFASYNKGAPLIAEGMARISSLGFCCADICGLHRNQAGGVLQADFLFVRPTLFEAYFAQVPLA